MMSETIGQTIKVKINFGIKQDHLPESGIVNLRYFANFLLSECKIKRYFALYNCDFM